MVNPEEDTGSIWEQYNGQPVVKPQLNDLVYRGELDNVPPEQLENNRPYYAPRENEDTQGALKLLQFAASNQTANDAGPQWDVEKAKQGILGIETGGNYAAQGPVVRYKDGTEDRAYGKYQVMGRNIPVWTKQVLGVAMTPEQFLQNKEAQERVFEAKFGESVKRYGNVADAASVWFSGKPINQAGNRSDVLGTTVPNYVAKFLSAYNGAPQRETPVEGVSNARGSVAAQLDQPDAGTLADVRAAVTKSRAPDFAAIVKALADQGGKGSAYINQVMQANRQQAMAARQKMASSVAKFDEDKISSLSDAIKRGAVRGYADGGEVDPMKEPDVGLSIEDWERGPTVNGKVQRSEHPFAPVFNLENWKKLPDLTAEDWKNKLYAMAQHYGEGAVNMLTAPKKISHGEMDINSPEAQRAASWFSNIPLSSVPLAAGKPSAGTLFSGGVEPKGNVNLQPMISAEMLKGPEVQTLDSFLSQIRGIPGVTKEGFDALVQKYQGMEPNARISKSEFEKSIPPSEYSKIDLIKETEEYNKYEENLRDKAKDFVESHGPEMISQNVSDNLGDQFSLEKWVDPESLQKFVNGEPLSKLPDIKETLEGMYGKDVVKTADETHLRNRIKDYFNEEIDRQLEYAMDHIRDMDIEEGLYRPFDYGGNYEANQRLVYGVKKPAYEDPFRKTDPNYFEIGVTHPNQKEGYGAPRGHYAHINPDRPEGGMVAHVRGSFMPEGGGLINDKGLVETKPNSAVIEEVQSDIAKQEKGRADLHQIHATAFKTGVQHALEGGATTVYLPTSKSIGLVRAGNKSSDYAPIYDKEIVKYGLNPLLKIDGVTSKLIGDGAYHEISFTPEAIQAILKGKGQRTPGYADGGLVTNDGQTPDGTGGNQYDAYGDVNAAQGGMIHAVEYDPDNINMIAQRIKEGTYA